MSAPLLAVAATIAAVGLTYVAMYAVAAVGVFALIARRSDRSTWNNLGRAAHVARELAQNPRMVPLAAIATLLIVAVDDLAQAVPEQIPDESELV